VPTDLTKFAQHINFPCILKPALIHCAVDFLRGRKVLIARNRGEFERHVAALPEASGKWLAQEVIPGPESNITVFGGYFDRSGVPRQTFTGRKLRQFPPGFGSASLARSETCRQTLDLSLDFLGKIGFKGVCGTEFKRDPRDDRLKIIEINPRPTLWFALTHAAGKRIVETACLDLAELPLPVQEEQIDGILWHYALKDFYSNIFYRMRGKSFIFPPSGVKTGVKGHVWAVFDRSDPLPALIEPLQFLCKLQRRL
jgi:predicted ATP-grasp superfamily ATP-dependent carboligase